MADVALLVTKAKQGDVDAFTELVRRYQSMALGYAYSIQGDFHLAEDVVQQAFFVAYQNLANLNDATRFGGWLRGIVRFECLHMLRTRSMPLSPIDNAAELVTSAPGPAEVAENRESANTILSAINNLPPGEREATLLFYFHDHSQRDVAEFLNLPVSTVNNRLRSARNHLRKQWNIIMTRDSLNQHALPDNRTVDVGEVVRVNGPVIDARFPADQRPAVLSALTLAGNESSSQLRLEVAQHLASDLVRCVLLSHHDDTSRPEPGTQLAPANDTSPASLDDVFIRQVIARLRRPESTQRVLETGIKAIDLFAPVPLGGLIGIAGDAGSGKMVLVEELIHRLAGSTGVLSIMVFVAASTEASQIRNFEYRTSAAVEAIYLPVADASVAGLGDITADLDAVVALSGELAQNRFYPAIDPLSSSSRLLNASVVGDEQVEIAKDVQQLLKQVIEGKDEDGDPGNRADRISRFLTQPFYVAAPYTKTPGISVSRAETITGCQALLAGTQGHLDSNDLYMTGSLKDSSRRPSSALQSGCCHLQDPLPNVSFSPIHPFSAASRFPAAS